MTLTVRPRISQTAADVRDHYDQLDRPYREIWGEHVHHGYWQTGREKPQQAVEALVELVMGHLAIAPGQRIGDIGCGYGAAARHILRRHDACITGFTISPAQAAFARSAPVSRGSFDCVLGDWLANDLPESTFDSLYAIESSEHFEDREAFFAQAARTLRPGGRLVVCAWLANEMAGPFAVRHLLEPICREGALPALDSLNRYQDLAAASGLQLMSVEDIGGNVHRTWAIVARRLAGKLIADPDYRRLVMDKSVRSRIFILSIPRLWLALRTGAMRYGVFVWRKPGTAGEDGP